MAKLLAPAAAMSHLVALPARRARAPRRPGGVLDRHRGTWPNGQQPDRGSRERGGVRLRRRLRRRGPRRLRPLRRYAWHERRRRRRGLRRRARARVCRRSGGRIPLAERSGECGARGLHGRRPGPDRRAARVTRTLGSAPLRARGRPRRRWVRCWWRWRLRWWRWPRLGRERRAHPMGRVPLPDGHRPRREHQRLLASTCAREPTPRDRPFELWLAPR